VELALIQLCNTDPEKKKSELTAEPKTATVNTSATESKPSAFSQEPKIKEIKASVSIPSFSIKDALKSGSTKIPSETIKEVSSNVEDIPVQYSIQETKSFTQQQLNVAWEKYALNCKTNEPRMHSTLVAQLPVLNNDCSIEFTISNPLQEEELLKLKPSLLNFLKKELSNSNLDLVVKISENQEGNKRLYTDQEKFDHLAEKNPGLIKLKQQFGLDFG
jgi:DNA polymerase-3 subunit gamma/tau